jgi:hypothetical protein
MHNQLMQTKNQWPPYLGSIQYNVIIRGDTTSQYNYVYGGNNSVDCFIARYPKDQLSASVPWQFYNGTTWVSDYTQAASIYSSTFGSVIQLGPNNYAAVFEPSLTNELHVVYATSPIGPWTNNTLVYQIPNLANGLTYFSYLHQETGNNGVYTLSYSSNTTIAQMLNDKGTYQPHFVKANILALSPFTVQKPADTLLSFTAKDVSQKVQLNWATAITTDNHFDVQRSPDGVNWTVIATVEGNDSTSFGNYADLDNNPIQGLNYYRIALYDIDSKLTYSAVKTINILQTVTLINFTAKRDGAEVQLNWATSSELNNPGFIVQRSTDTTIASGWATIATVAGKGTTDTVSNYQAFDDKPFDGINYYRLEYYANGVSTTSAVKAVDMTQTLALIIYPNPTTSAIKFMLKGYQGSSFNVALYDVSGRIFDKETFSLNVTESYVLQATPAAGLYIIKVTGAGLGKNGKVIVQ